MKVAIFLGFCLILVSCRKSRPGPSSETTTQAAEETTTEAVTTANAGEADDDDVVSLVKSYDHRFQLRRLGRVLLQGVRVQWAESGGGQRHPGPRGGA